MVGDYPNLLRVENRLTLQGPGLGNPWVSVDVPIELRHSGPDQISLFFSYIEYAGAKSPGQSCSIRPHMIEFYLGLAWNTLDSVPIIQMLLSTYIQLLFISSFLNS